MRSLTTRNDPPAVRRRHAVIEKLVAERGGLWTRQPGNRWVLNRSIDMKVTDDKDLPLRVRCAGTVIAGFWMPVDALDFGEWWIGGHPT